MKIGKLVLLPYYAPGDMSLANAVREVAGKHHAILLANHGPIVAGKNLQSAVYASEELEETAKLFLLLRGNKMKILDPEQVADLHHLYFDFGEDSYTAAYDALAVRAGTATSWEELSASPEMADYRAALARDKELCVGLDAEFEATKEREVFADTPWIPNELKEVVEAVIGCAGYPEHPEDVYRPPSTTP